MDGEFPSRVNNKPFKIVESIAILFLESDSDVDLPVELSESRGYVALYFIAYEFSDRTQFKPKLNNAFSVVDNLYLWATRLDIRTDIHDSWDLSERSGDTIAHCFHRIQVVSIEFNLDRRF